MKTNRQRLLGWAYSFFSRQVSLGSAETNFEEDRILIASVMGLFLLRRGKLVPLIFNEQCYGLTRLNGRWFVAKKRFEPGNISCAIASFRLEGDTLTDLRIEVERLDPDLHQMDFIGRSLYVTDTANNRVIVFDEMNGKLENRREFFPPGRLERGVESPNYVHLNSVFSNGRNIFLIYHNQGSKTQRRSQIATLDLACNVLDVTELNALCAHNILFHEEGRIYCDSLRGKVWWNDEVLMEYPLFMRGAALHGRNLYVAGSENIAMRERRQLLPCSGQLFKYNWAQRKVVAQMTIPQLGMIREIRLCDQPDFGLSNDYTSAGSGAMRC